MFGGAMAGAVRGRRQAQQDVRNQETHDLNMEKGQEDLRTARRVNAMGDLDYQDKMDFRNTLQAKGTSFGEIQAQQAFAGALEIQRKEDHYAIRKGIAWAFSTNDPAERNKRLTETMRKSHIGDAESIFEFDEQGNSMVVRSKSGTYNTPLDSRFSGEMAMLSLADKLTTPNVYYDNRLKELAEDRAAQQKLINWAKQKDHEHRHAMQKQQQTHTNAMEQKKFELENRVVTLGPGQAVYDLNGAMLAHHKKPAEGADPLTSNQIAGLIRKYSTTVNDVGVERIDGQKAGFLRRTISHYGALEIASNVYDGAIKLYQTGKYRSFQEAVSAAEVGLQSFYSGPAETQTPPQNTNGAPKEAPPSRPQPKGELSPESARRIAPKAEQEPKTDGPPKDLAEWEIVSRKSPVTGEVRYLVVNTGGEPIELTKEQARRVFEAQSGPKLYGGMKEMEGERPWLNTSDPMKR